jgi:hypothetical protein
MEYLDKITRQSGIMGGKLQSLRYAAVIFERYEIKNMIEARMKKYNAKNNVSWEDIKETI